MLLLSHKLIVVHIDFNIITFIHQLIKHTVSLTELKSTGFPRLNRTMHLKLDKYRYAQFMYNGKTERFNTNVYELITINNRSTLYVPLY